MESRFNNSGVGELKVPGFGDKITFTLDQRDRFRHGVEDFRAPRLIVREVAMLRFMDSITDKPRWNEKIFNEEIVKKWWDEAAAFPDGMISEHAFDWCMTELRDRSKDFERDGFVRTFEGGARCAKSDQTIPTELRDELRAAVAPLLAFDDDKKDWHPKSNDQVLNLVHPSLYPLIYGSTLVLEAGQVGLLDCMKSCGKGVVSEPDKDLGDQPLVGRYFMRSPDDNFGQWSNRFQWLPCEVKFQGESGTGVKITSYINNLKPTEHRGLYEVIEKIISKVVPLWNAVLVKGYGPSPRIPANEPVMDDRPSWVYDDTINYEDKVKLAKEYMALPDNPAYQPGEYQNIPDDWETQINEKFGEWNASNVANWKYERVRKIFHPEPGKDLSYDRWKAGDTISFGFWRHFDNRTSGECPHLETESIEKQFRQQGLQVIVKMSSIELTPEKPSYQGGNWHLEGMLNEHIVATAIYYYDTDNVTESRLSIRQEAYLNEMGLRYEQDDHEPLSLIFGTESMRSEPGVQELGSISTPAGRLLAFPNTLQHKVESFSLLDQTRPGHRRFLVLWLVDPNYRVVSTANVPPQQQEWFLHEARKTGWEEKLPRELWDMVLEHGKRGQISLEEAKDLRLELMGERTVFADNLPNRFDRYNLCEH